MSRVRVAYTAGEAIGPDLFVFYRSLGINLKQLYGSTETAVFVCVQPNGQVKADTVGPPVDGVELQVTDAGEILIRSPGLLREYYKNPEATAEVKDADGWYHTGDAGYFDPDGHLKIIDRAKDVGKLAGGTLFAPKYIENKLKFFPYIKEAVAFGDGRDQVMAIINIDFEAVRQLGRAAQHRRTPGYLDLAGRDEVYAAGARVRREGQRRPRGRPDDERLADPPLPGAAQGTRRRRRRADAHAQGAPRFIAREVPAAGRRAVHGSGRLFHRDRRCASRTAAPDRCRPTLDDRDAKTFAPQRGEATAA